MKKCTLSDSELLSLYSTGNEGAFAHLLRRYKSKVFTAVYLIVKDRDVATDLTQDVFIKVVDMLRADRYREEDKFDRWLMRIAHNMAIDFFRRKKKTPTRSIDDGGEVLNDIRFSEAPTEHYTMQEEVFAQLRQLIEQLPDSQREVLVLRHYADLSFKEIADKTGVSINTALGRMRYAILNLRRMMQNQPLLYDQNVYP